MNEIDRKKEKAFKYSNEINRFKIENFEVLMNSEHDTRTIKYTNENGYSCTCDFYKNHKICSHIMAIQEILKKINL